MKNDKAQTDTSCHLYKWAFIALLFFVFTNTTRANIPIPTKQHSSQKIDSLRKQLFIQKPDTTKVKTLIALATSFQEKDIRLAFGYAFRAAKLSYDLGFDLGKARSYFVIGTLYDKTAQSKSALNYYLLSLSLFEKTYPDSTKYGKTSANYISLLYNNIGGIYFQMDDYDKTKLYYRKGILIREQYHLNDKQFIAISYINLGLIELKQSKGTSENPYNKALSYYQKGLLAADSIAGADNIKAELYLNMGDAYYALETDDSAEYYYRNAIQSASLSGAELLLTHLHCKLGAALQVQHKLKEAEKAYRKCIVISNRVGTKKDLAEAYKALSEIYAAQGNHKTSLDYYTKYHHISGELQSKQSVSVHQVNELQSKFAMERMAAKMALLNMNKEVADAKADNDRMLRNLFISIAIICVFAARNIVLRQKQKNRILSEEKKLLEIQKQQTEIDNVKLQRENAEARYETLKSKVNPHFLFNNLNTLSSIVVKDSFSAVEYISRFSELYRMILKTGNQMMVSLEEELQVVNNYAYLQRMGFGEKVDFNIAVPKEMLSFYLPPFALQMVVENAIKHNIIARSMNIHIKIYTEKDTIIIRNNLQKKHTDIQST